VNILYFDTSALLKLFVPEKGSDIVREVWDPDSIVAAASIIYVEARAALATAERATHRPFGHEEHQIAKRELELLWDAMAPVSVTAPLVLAAGELAERYGLRGYDVHLTSALLVRADALVSADVALLRAAQMSGLDVIDVRG
jgi:predicted nucleic acid-binding protein